MKEGVPRFSCLPWPRETPVQRFNHQELRLMKSGAAYDEWHFHPQTEWYLSESMRHAMLRELTAKYLDKRAERKTVNSFLWIARSRLATLALGTDPYTQQLAAVFRRFIENVSSFEHENIEFEERKVTSRALGLYLKKRIEAPHRTEGEKRRLKWLLRKVNEWTVVVRYRPFVLEAGCCINVLEAGGEFPGDGTHWEAKRPQHLPARMRHQLPYFRAEFEKLLEQSAEEDPIQVDYRSNELSPGFAGQRQFPNPYVLEGLAPYIELQYYDRFFNYKEAMDLAEIAKDDQAFVQQAKDEMNITPERKAMIEEHQRLRKEVAARRRAAGHENVDTDDEWHVMPSDCPDGPPLESFLLKVTSREECMREFRRQQKISRKKKDREHKENMERPVIPRLPPSHRSS